MYHIVQPYIGLLLKISVITAAGTTMKLVQALISFDPEIEHPTLTLLVSLNGQAVAM